MEAHRRYLHAELMTVKEYAETLGMVPERVLAKLERNGVTVNDLSETLKTVGQNNGMSPQEVAAIIQKRGEGMGQGRE